MHNDYAEEFTPPTTLSEERCGELAVQHLLKGGRGHWGPLEHPSLTLKVQADHNTIMQLRTHRHSTHDVQSMRYTGDRIRKVAAGQLQVSDAFVIRPIGTYKDREGQNVEWTQGDIDEMEAICLSSCMDYSALRDRGVPEEMARGALVTCYRQNDVLTMSLRGWLHVMEVRIKPDAQWEFRQLADLVLPELRAWAPVIMAWWEGHRANRSMLAP
jgi:thymidylate synthase (FAD)